jgi:hypothetical protein
VWPRGFQRFRLPGFHDIRHMRVVRSSASRTGRLYPQKCSWYSFSLGAESTPGPWCGRKEMSQKNPETPRGIDPGTVPLVGQRHNYYATLCVCVCVCVYIYMHVYYYYYYYSALGLVWAGTRAQSGDRYGLVRCILGKFCRVVCHCFPPYIYTHTHTYH